MIIIFRSGSGGDGSFIVNERETWIIFKKKLYETWNKPLDKRTFLKKIFVTAHFNCKTYKK